MATITNQATLRTAVADWLNRTDLTNSQLDQFIEMGEAMIYESLRVPTLERKATYSVAKADSNITVPNGYLDMIELRLLGKLVQQAVVPGLIVIWGTILSTVE